MRCSFGIHIVPDRALSEISNRIVGRILLYTIDIPHYFSSDVGFTSIVAHATGQSGVETKYGVPIV